MKSRFFLLSLLVGIFAAAINTSLTNEAIAVDTPCVVIGSNASSATYYTLGSVCGQGSGISLSVVPGMTAGDQKVFANKSGVDVSCSGVETVSYGGATTVYCVMFTPGQNTAQVKKGNPDGSRDDYPVAATTAEALKAAEDKSKAVSAAGETAGGQAIADIVCKQYTGGTGAGDLQALERCQNEAKVAWAECSLVNVPSRYGDGTVTQQVTAEHAQLSATCLKKKFPSQAEKIDAGLVLAAITKVDEAKKSTEDALTPKDDTPEQEEKTCGSELTGIGWIVCPVITAASSFADGVWALFEQLLVLNPISGDTGGAIYKTWETMRNIANTLLIVFFLFVIFSQVSNVGISNYGIKKLLPKIIIAAIAINVSFLIMQISVDLANVLGKTIDDTISQYAPSVNLADVGFSSLIVDILAAGGLTFITAGAMAVAGVALAAVGGPVALLFLALLILPSIIGIVAGVMALVFRSAVIPILATIAPLAIVAWILPNTEGLFSKWRKTFTGLLFMYPLAALYYGALKFFSLTILNDSNAGTFQRLMALSLLFIGTFVVLIIAIKSNSIVGGMMKGIAGTVNKAIAPARKLGMGVAGGMAALNFMKFKNNPGAIAPGKKGLFGRHSVTRGVGRVLNRFDRAKWAREQGAAVAKGDQQQGFQEWAIGEGSEKFAKQSGITDNSPTGKAYMSDLTSRAVKNAEVRLSSEGMDGIQRAFEAALKSGDTITATAAQNQLYAAGGGGVSKVRESIHKTPGANRETIDALKANVRTNHGNLKSSAADQMSWATSDQTMSEAINNPSTWKMSNAEFMQQNWRSQQIALETGAVGQTQVSQIYSSKELSDKISPEVAATFESIRNGAVPKRAVWAPAPSSNPTPQRAVLQAQPQVLQQTIPSPQRAAGTGARGPQRRP